MEIHIYIYSLNLFSSLLYPLLSPIKIQLESQALSVSYETGHCREIGPSLVSRNPELSRKPWFHLSPTIGREDCKDPLKTRPHRRCRISGPMRRWGTGRADVRPANQANGRQACSSKKRSQAIARATNVPRI